ncbi:hypothetical protein V6N11_038055 [Hibiscus sabdariffa]|uniref:Uncharacterized protein n=1 Tax=Hibiscus sabdariffa TaxID=183260 RepID=A0ABR1ZXG6_9ROSI
MPSGLDDICDQHFLSVALVWGVTGFQPARRDGGSQVGERFGFVRMETQDAIDRFIECLHDFWLYGLHISNGGNVRWIWLYGIRLSMGWWGWYVGWRYLVWVLSMSCITRSGWHIAVRVVALRLVSPEEMVKGDAPMIEGVLELDSTSHQAKEFDFRNSNSNCNLDLRPDNIINEVDNVANAIVPMTNFVVQSEELLTVEVVLSKGLSHKV